MDINTFKQELENITKQQWVEGRGRDSKEASLHNRELRVLIFLYKDFGEPSVGFYCDDQKIWASPIPIERITKITKNKDCIDFYTDYLPSYMYAASVKFF